MRSSAARRRHFCACFLFTRNALRFLSRPSLLLFPRLALRLLLCSPLRLLLCSPLRLLLCSPLRLLLRLSLRLFTRLSLRLFTRLPFCGPLRVPRYSLLLALDLQFDHSDASFLALCLLGADAFLFCEPCSFSRRFGPGLPLSLLAFSPCLAFRSLLFGTFKARGAHLPIVPLLLLQLLR